MPSRRQRPQSDRVTIPDAAGMLILVFRQHCQKRHPLMKFWSRGEHDADHRLHADSLDHVHSKVEGEVTEDAGADEQDQDRDNGQHGS